MTNWSHLVENNGPELATVAAEGYLPFPIGDRELSMTTPSVAATGASRRRVATAAARPGADREPNAS